ncbi:MAG TPA: SDR family oxidoreductase [Chloroflexota bacterium]|nr:SDR family oxidoreductase [Chloroflexota bacterium]
MKALVVGAPGQVGSALMRILPTAGFEAVGTYRSRPRPGMQRLDVTDGAAVDDVIDRERPALVFLTAALTAVDYCEDHADEATAINVRGSAAVARAAARHGAKLVFYSTEYVFDGAAGPYGEDDPISPAGVYAWSKAEGERAVLDAAPDALIARTTVVFSWDPDSLNFGMQVWKRLSAGERMRVPGDQVSNPTLADFLALATIVLAQDDVRGIVNVVGQDRVDRATFARRLAAGLGLDAGLIDAVATADLHQAAARPLNAGLRTEKLAALLGRPPMSLDDAIAIFARRARAGTSAAT